jgi:uncharacterized membrane protein YeiB
VAVGHIGLTVYLKTIAFTTLGYGDGMAYRIGPPAITAVAVAIFAVPFFACSLWLQRFRYGSAERLWRAGNTGIRSTTAPATLAASS